MKKLALLFLAVLFISCSADETSNPTPPVDCNCDRIVQINTFNVVGTPQNPALNYYSVYTTINDCTQIQREKTHNTTNPNLVPKLGDCK
jgi:hypothetical protein